MSKQYTCSLANDCVARKLTASQLSKGEPFIPQRLLVCGHSVCELCIVEICHQNKEFIKCIVCTFITTISPDVRQYVIQNESEMRKWLDPSAVGAQVLLFETNGMFPIDFYQIGAAIDSGVITASKTAEMIDLDLDDESTVQQSAATLRPIINSLQEDDTTISNILSRVPKTAPINFQKCIENGVKTFTDLSAVHFETQRNMDNTTEWFNKIRKDVRQLFHSLHSLLQMREKELLDEMMAMELARRRELHASTTEILSKRSELKGKLLQSIQVYTDNERNKLQNLINQLVRDSSGTTIGLAQNDFKLTFDTNIEDQLKKFGKFQKQVNNDTPVKSEPMEQTSGVGGGGDEEDITEIVEVMDQSESNDDTMNRQVVNVIYVESPHKFYVQKVADKERFGLMNQMIQNICKSPYNHAPAIGTYPTGDELLAYSSSKKCWCRGRLIHFREGTNQSGEHLADIFLLDYGLNETIHWYNVREKKIDFDTKKYLPFAYKCCLYSIKPKTLEDSRKKSYNWSEKALEVFKLYVTGNQLTLYEFEMKNEYKLVDLIHYDVPNVSYKIPSAIQVLVNLKFAEMTNYFDFNTYCRHKNQLIKYKQPDIPKGIKTVSVMVSHVETPDLFYVQLQRQFDDLVLLMKQMNETYNDSNAGIYTYYCPRINTPCAVICEGESGCNGRNIQWQLQYYRGNIIKIDQPSNEYVVQLVDYGYAIAVKQSYLRLLRDEFLTTPILAIPCGLIHVKPVLNNKWTEDAIQFFNNSTTKGSGKALILAMTTYELDNFSDTYSVYQNKVNVVLRSYNGGAEAKINELMVLKKKAHSTGDHSLCDIQRSLNSSQESLLSTRSSTSISEESEISLPLGASALKICRDLVDRHVRSDSDKRSSLIKVKVTSIENPNEIYVQIDKKEVNEYFETQERALVDDYKNKEFFGEVGFNPNDWCAIKVEGSWKRGKVLNSIDSTSQVPRFMVLAVDCGTKHDIPVSQMLPLSNVYTKDGAFAMNCVFGLKPTGGDNWSHTAIDDMKEFLSKNHKNMYILVKEKIIDSEPIRVKLYSKETTIPSAFGKQQVIYTSVSTFLIEKGLALKDTNYSSNGVVDSDDDTDINTEMMREVRPEMPQSYFESEGSVLKDLMQRSKSIKPVKIESCIKYIEPIYPKTKTFYAIACEFVANKSFDISFRQFYENMPKQPLINIEDKIQAKLTDAGEFGPFIGELIKGNACTAYFEYDKTWNRAEIVGVTETDDISKLVIRYVDYGNEEQTIIDKISSDVFGREVPKLAIRCHIINIQPVNEEADIEIRNIIYAKVLDHKCRFHWENFPTQSPMKVSIDIIENGLYVPLIRILENKGLLVADREEDLDEEVETILNIEGLIHSTYGLYPIVFETNRFYQVVISHSLAGKHVFFNVDAIDDPTDNEIVINKEHKAFISMLSKLRNKVKHFLPLPRLAEGQTCVAEYDYDHQWYRGLILNVDTNVDSGVANIYFVDYGNSEKVSINKLKVIQPEFLHPRSHAIFCEYYNVKPARNRLWSKSKDLFDKIAQYVNNLCSDQRLLARFKSDKYPLKIDLYLSCADDHTKPDRHVFQDFVDNGLLEFCDPQEVWRKPIEVQQSIRNIRVKSEPTNQSCD
ncbi:RING finger protein 17-like [Oppia nitens]|uniref:RING finger protein 17-like n=1 Tax=Oppia nitens TaxID=1686743 RepID=UPI0023DC82FF|nr:RING finger protein 17-like [Oppia nitens]